MAPTHVHVFASFNCIQIGSEKVPKEIAFLHLLKHKFIIRMYDYFSDKYYWYIVMENPVGYIDIRQLIKLKGGPLTENLARVIIRNLLEAIHYCFSMGVLHQDIKGSNILVQPVTGDIKLIDFGCVEHFSTEKYSFCKG